MLNTKICIFGCTGLVGSALVRILKDRGFNNLICSSSNELNLINQDDVDNFFCIYKPEWVFLAAAKVGGILANNVYRAEFIYENLQIQNNVIHHSYLNQVKKLLFLGAFSKQINSLSRYMSMSEFMNANI